MHAHDAQREVLMPRTLPVQSLADFAPYHWVENERGNLSLRKGAPPKITKTAVADFAKGATTLGEMLDRIGVPKSK